MHETLKTEVMGQGYSPERLNYRTGRFADSVRVERLQFVSQTNQRDIVADISYMYQPYSIFAPGGRLHKILREPSRLAGESIRRILQKLAIDDLNLIEARDMR